MAELVEGLKLTAKTTVGQVKKDLFARDLELQYLLDLEPAWFWVVGELYRAAALEPMPRQVGGLHMESNTRRVFADEFRILPVDRGPLAGPAQDPDVIDGAPAWLTGTVLEKELVAMRRAWASFTPRLAELGEKKRLKTIADEAELDDSIQDVEEAAKPWPWQQVLPEVPFLEYVETLGLAGRAKFHLLPSRTAAFMRGGLPTRDRAPRS